MLYDAYLGELLQSAARYVGGWLLEISIDPAEAKNTAVRGPALAVQALPNRRPVQAPSESAAGAAKLRW